MSVLAVRAGKLSVQGDELASSETADRARVESGVAFRYIVTELSQSSLLVHVTVRVRNVGGL